MKPVNTLRLQCLHAVHLLSAPGLDWKIGTVGFCCSGGRVLLHTVLNKTILIGSGSEQRAASSRGVTVSKLSSPHHTSSNVSCCSTCQSVKQAEPPTFPFFVRVKHICVHVFDVQIHALGCRKKVQRGCLPVLMGPLSWHMQRKDTKGH